MRRIALIALLAITVLATISVGCTKTTETRKIAEETPSENEIVIVNMASRWEGEGDREQFILDIVKEFNARNPDMQINVTFTPDRGPEGINNSWRREVAEGLKTGTYPYDIFYANAGDPYNIFGALLGEDKWGPKHLVDFSEVEGFLDTQKTFILEDPKYVAPFDGIIPGPFIEGYNIALWYNEEVAKKIGIEIKEQDMSIDDFITYVKAVDDYNAAHEEKIGAILTYGDWSTTEYFYRHLFKTAVGDYDEIIDTTSFSEQKQAALLKTFQTLEELSQYHPLIEGYETLTFSEDKGKILAGEALFAFNGAWMYSHWTGVDENQTQHMRPAELPGYQPIDFYPAAYTPQFVVAKDSPRKDEAVRFLMYMSSARVAEQWVRTTKAPTGIKGNLASAEEGDDQFAAFHAYIESKYSTFHYDDSSAFITGKNHSTLDGKIDQLAQELLDGKITAQEAYDNVMTAVS